MPTSVRTPFRPFELAGALALITTLASPALAAEPAPSLRAQLEQYRVDTAGGGTWAVLSQLTHTLSASQQAPESLLEARFLRAAAGTDLLVLARVRGDAALEAELARALGVEAPALPALLDAELASCTSGVYRTPAQQMRGTVALLAAPGGASAELLAATSGSQRDLLLLRAVGSAVSQESDLAALAALRVLGTDPCSGVCPAPYDRIAAAARPAIAAFADAGHAVGRLRAAGAAGDPLARATEVDREAMALKLFTRSLLPPPQLADASSWSRADGAPLTASPELLVLVGDRGIRYGFAPRVRMTERGVLELFSRGEPTWPHLTEVRFARELRPYIEPLPELVSVITRVQKDGPMVAAIGVEPDTNAHVLAHVLASWKRSGTPAELLLSAAGNQLGRVQPVQLWSDADGGPEAPLGMRVRLGGYSLKQGQSPTLDIPRVRTDVGWRFDLATLDNQVRSQHYPTARISFMADVAAEDLISAVLQLSPASDTLAIALP